MIAAGATLRTMRERKPLVHQITNYVVMNETANATLALGALPVMAHAVEEVEEMVGIACALVLNIGTLSRAWVEAMLFAGRAATRAADPDRARSRRCRRDGVPHGDGPQHPRRRRRHGAARQRRRGGDAGRRRGRGARRRVDGRRRGACRARARAGAPARRRSPRSPGRSTTSPTASACSRSRTANELLATVTGTGCMSSALTGCFLAGKPDQPLEAAAEALVAFGVAAEDAARRREGPGTFHVHLYDALVRARPGHARRAHADLRVVSSTSSGSSACSRSSSAAGSRTGSSTTPPRSAVSSSRRTRSSRACTSASICSRGASSAFVPRR